MDTKLRTDIDIFISVKYDMDTRSCDV